MRKMTKIFNKDEGFTGLEAAIVLIAFVVVAAVFSYVVLGAGFFTTQKAQEVVYSSVDMASSSMEVLGNVYGHGTIVLANPSESNITALRFVVGLTAGGAPVDLANTNLVFSGSGGLKDLIRDSSIKATEEDVVTDIGSATAADTWYIIDITNGDKGSLLDNQKQVTIYANLHEKAIMPNDDFSLEIKPPVGAAYAIKRKAPAGIKEINILT
nr:archaellin/type IV pilin N-terminal domain-containing protein [Methanomicrobium mobile]